MSFIDAFSLGNPKVSALTSYLKAFDWYIVTAVPEHETQARAANLVSRQSLIIGLIFLGSLGLAFVLVSKISRPLFALTGFAKELPYYDFTHDESASDKIKDLANKYRDEVRRLAQSFNSGQLARCWTGCSSPKWSMGPRLLSRCPQRRRSRTVCR